MSESDERYENYLLLNKKKTQCDTSRLLIYTQFIKSAKNLEVVILCWAKIKSLDILKLM